MEKTKESRINVFIIRSRGSKRNERKEKRPLSYTLLSYFNLDEIIKRETSQRVFFLSISRVMEISPARVVPFQDRIIISNRDNSSRKFTGRIRDLRRIVTIAVHRHCQLDYANSHGGRYKQRDTGLLPVSSSSRCLTFE